MCSASLCIWWNKIVWHAKSSAEQVQQCGELKGLPAKGRPQTSPHLYHCPVQKAWWLHGPCVKSTLGENFVFVDSETHSKDSQHKGLTRKTKTTQVSSSSLGIYSLLSRKVGKQTSSSWCAHLPARLLIKSLPTARTGLCSCCSFTIPASTSYVRFTRCWQKPDSWLSAKGLGLHLVKSKS